MWRSLRLRRPLKLIRVTWQGLSDHLLPRLAQLKPSPVSTDYLAWRHQFLHQRLRLALFITLFWFLIISAEGLYSVLFEFERLKSVASDSFGDMSIAYQWRGAAVAYFAITNIVIVVCLIGQKTSWGKRYPTALFLFFSGSLAMLPHIVFTFFGLPETPGPLLFLCLALLIPIHWRLHLIYQSIAIFYYAAIYPLIGLATTHYATVSNLYSRELIIHLVCLCSVSIISVYVYERLKRSEFEVNRRLQMFLHSVSHDLQAPVIGSSMVLKRLLNKAASKDEINVKYSTLQQLLRGSDRQLALIHSLLDAHTLETQGIQLNCTPIQLKPLVEAVLLDLDHVLVKKHVQLTNHIADTLPCVSADADQLWRVFSNLIGNALKHNPHGIHLVLNANVAEPDALKRMGAQDRHRLLQTQPNVPMLLCTVEDTGMGIAPEQCQRLFELYARGSNAQYMPGLGLGLYLCKQIIEAHGGQLGVISQLGEGSTFWFTLPLHPT